MIPTSPPTAPAAPVTREALPEALRGRLALRVSEVARLIGCSAPCVRGMIARGELPGRKVGEGEKSVSYVVPVDGLLAWLNGSEGGRG